MYSFVLFNRNLCSSKGYTDLDRFYYVFFRGGSFKDMISVASSPSTDVGTIGRDAKGTWQNWDLNDTSKAVIAGYDTICVGTAVDMTALNELEPMEEDGPQVPPVPIFYMYNNLGVLTAYHMIDVPAAKAGKECPSLRDPVDAPGVNKSAATPAPAPVAAPPPAVKPKKASVSTIPAAATPTSSSSQKAPEKSSSSAVRPSAATPESVPKPTPAPIAKPSFQKIKPKDPGAIQRQLDEKEEPTKIVRNQGSSDEVLARSTAPKSSAAMDRLSKQLEDTYLAMTEELRALEGHIKLTEELVKDREQSFVELDKFLKLTKRRISKAQETRNLAESVSGEFSDLRANFIKGKIRLHSILYSFMVISHLYHRN